MTLLGGMALLTSASMASQMTAVSLNTSDPTGNLAPIHFTFLPGGCCAALAGPADNQPLSLPLPLNFGANDFFFWLNGERSGTTWSLNVFLNLSFDTPEISVYAAPSSSIGGPFQPFAVNPASNSTYTGGGAKPAAGSLSFPDGSDIITLTQFWFVEYTNNGGRDFISESGTFTPDNRPDGVGFFQLTVSPAQTGEVPEPSTAVLLGAALAGLIAARKARQSYVMINRTASARSFTR